MSIQTFIPEVWSAALLSSLKKALVYGDLVNTDYEGDISEYGDTVTINSVSRPTISTYTPGSTTITPEQLTTAQRKLLIDQAKYFAFEVDDVDKRQAAGNMSSEAMTRAGYGLRKTADSFVAGLYTGVSSDNDLGTVTVTSGNAYDKLIDLGVKLDETDTPEDGRYVTVTPWYYGLLLKDDRFVRVDASGSSAGLRNGNVGMVDNMVVLKSNQCPSFDSGDDAIIQAGWNGAISYADQIIETEAYRSQTRFADVVRGLHVYGAKLTRPDNIATMRASQS